MKETMSTIFHYMRTKNLNFTSRDKLENYQRDKVSKHLKWVMKNSPFYADYLKNYDLSNISSLPKINKTIMMDNFNQLNTVGITKEEAFEIAFKSEDSRDFSPTINDITVGLSSGTSGNRGLFLVSPQERAAWAGTILAKLLPHSLFFGQPHKIAFFLRANSNLYSTVNKGKLKFNFFDLLSPLENHIIELNNYQPTILVAPASMLRMLSVAFQNGSLKINPKKIISVAEVLEPLDKMFIENTFQTTLHQVYQCTEGFLASTCEKGNLHLNEDLVYIEKEFVSENKFMPIITDFSRFTQPIIRYELNDILTLSSTPCSCGSHFTTIEQIEGRSDDVFYLPSTTEDKLVPVFPDFIRKVIMKSSDCILEYQVKQISSTKATIYFNASSPEQVDGIKKEIQSQFNELCLVLKCQVPSLIFVNSLDYEQGKKLKRVIRQFNM